MHQHRRVVIADLRDRLDQARRQVELANFVDNYF
jgi:hypothetical protein